MDFEYILKNRRSVRRFKAKEVSDDLIKYIVEMASWAPNACNRQLWNFVCVERDDFKKRLEGICKTLANINPPRIIFACYDNRYNLSRHANVQSLAAAIQNMLLAAYSKGLGTVWIENFGPEEKIKKILSIPDDLSIYAAIAVGYPEGIPKAPKRRPVSEILHFGDFKGGTFPYSNDPRQWTFNKIKNYVDYAVASESPQKNFHKPQLMREFKQEIGEFKNLEGKTLFIYPIFGNYLYYLLESGKIKGEITAYCYGEGVSGYLEKKKENIGLKDEINFVNFAKGSSFDENLPFTDGQFDQIICAKKIEGLPVQEPLLLELKRVLNSSGQLYILMNNSWSVYSLLKKVYYRFAKTLGREIVEPNGPLRPLSVFKMKRLLQDFKIERWKGINLLPYLKFQGPPFFGLPIIPFKSLEKYFTKSFLKYFCNSQFIVARKK
ncbi:MAG: nitroreductase family protein [Candidatus Woesearchaeota archaeon]